LVNDVTERREAVSGRRSRALSVSQETGRKTLYQLVRRWVEERGSAHHSRLVGKASSRQGFGLIGGAAPPDTELLSSLTLLSKAKCKPKRRPPH
jgi:hypothetical protein